MSDENVRVKMAGRIDPLYNLARVLELPRVTSEHNGDSNHRPGDSHSASLGCGSCFPSPGRIAFVGKTGNKILSARHSRVLVDSVNLASSFGRRPAEPI